MTWLQKMILGKDMVDRRNRVEQLCKDSEDIELSFRDAMEKTTRAISAANLNHAADTGMNGLANG